MSKYRYYIVDEYGVVYGTNDTCLSYEARDINRIVIDVKECLSYICDDATEIVEFEIDPTIEFDTYPIEEYK